MQGKNKPRLWQRINSDIVSLFVCIIAAIGLWLYVTYVDNPDMSRWVTNVPISIIGEDTLQSKGLSISSISDEYIDVKIRAKRTDLQYFTAETVSATADVSRISHSGDAIINVAVTLPSSIADASVVDRRDSEVSLTVENLAEKEFDIEISVTKQPPSGYIIHSYSYDSSSTVTISGPASAVDSVAKVCTSSIDLSSATTNVVYPSPLIAFDVSGKAVSGVSFDVSEINVTVELYKLKEFTVDVAYSVSNPALTAKVEPASVTLSGPPDTIDSLTSVSTEPIDATAYHAGDETDVALDLPGLISVYEADDSNVSVTFEAAEEIAAANNQ